jgi:hypothetical protein
MKPAGKNILYPKFTVQAAKPALVFFTRSRMLAKAGPCSGSVFPGALLGLIIIMMKYRIIQDYKPHKKLNTAL